MYFLIQRIEPHYGGDRDEAPNIFPVGCIDAENEQEAIDSIGLMRISVRGREKLLLVRVLTQDELMQAKAIERERVRCCEDAAAVLDRIHWSVE